MKSNNQILKDVLLAVILLACQSASAAETTIDDPKTTTQGPVTPPLDGVDILIIAPSGSITTSADNTYGISATGGTNIITNNGSISTAGIDAIGISAAGNTNALNNFGSIRTTGNLGPAQGAHGIYAPGNTNAIINFGSIGTVGNGSHGIYVNGSTNTISNYGSIGTVGFPAYGIYAFGNTNTIFNYGSIVGGSSDGIYANGNTNIIANYGSVSTVGAGSNGLYVVGNLNTVRNFDSISTSGDSANGIGSGTGISNAFANHGSISTVGGSSYGIYANGNTNTIANYGSIATGGPDAYGISADGTANTIYNSGVISVSGIDAYGVNILGNSNILSNSGSIVSLRSYAVFFDGTGNTLNVLNNFLGGKINLGTSGIANVITGANYSKLYSFEGTNISLAGSGPVPLFRNLTTQQVATYDPTIFAGSSDALADMTSTISSLSPGRVNGTDNSHPFWAKGFGMKSSYVATNATLERNYSFSGVAIGYDIQQTKDLTIGVLGGYGQTSLTADGRTAQSFNNTSDAGFLGIYGQKRWKDLAFDFALNGGSQSFRQQRYVNDNLAYLGNSSTNASYQGLWLSPEVGVTVNAGELNGWSFLPTARLRYAQQWLGSYGESGGGLANANVNGRSVGIGQSFVGIGTRKTMKISLGKDTKMVLEAQVGYMYRGVVGDSTVGVTMIGQSLSLPSEMSSRNAVLASAGISLDFSSSVALNVRGDFATGGGMNYGGGGWAGLSLKF